MKITQETLKRIIAEEIGYQKEATQQQYDPTPGKNADGSRASSWTSTEVPSDPKAADQKAWFDLVNASSHTPEQIKQIAQQAKADPEKAKSLAGRTASINGKILVAGNEQLGKLMSAGQFGKEAREIAKNVLQKRSAGQVSRLASYKKTDKMFGGTGKDVDLSAVGASVGQIRETITKEALKRIIKEERDALANEGWTGIGGSGVYDQPPKDAPLTQNGALAKLIGLLSKAGKSQEEATDIAWDIIHKHLPNLK